MLWIANILIVIGLWTLGYKWRPAFLFSVAGEALYIKMAYDNESWELFSICIVFCLLALRNYFKWAAPSTPN